jgi:hypothetical protein
MQGTFGSHDRALDLEGGQPLIVSFCHLNNDRPHLSEDDR